MAVERQVISAQEQARSGDGRINSVEHNGITYSWGIFPYGDISDVFSLAFERQPDKEHRETNTGVIHDLTLEKIKQTLTRSYKLSDEDLKETHSDTLIADYIRLMNTPQRSVRRQ